MSLEIQVFVYKHIKHQTALLKTDHDAQNKTSIDNAKQLTYKQIDIKY